MIKVKSKSKEGKESNQELINRYMIHPRKTEARESRLLKTADNRNFSNQCFPPNSHFTEQFVSVKQRQFSSSKNQRKQSKNMLEVHPLKIIYHEHKESRKHQKTFIGTKLKKKLQKYLLFIALVNYSLRINYRRPQAKKYRLYVGRGNNSKLIKKIFLNRFWWILTHDENQANLIWTQKSKKSAFAAIEGVDKEPAKYKQWDHETIPRLIKERKKRESKKGEFQQQFEIILSQKDRQIIKRECSRQTFNEDLKTFLKKSKNEKRNSIRVTHNHIQNHKLLTNKKNLFYNLKLYCQQHKQKLFDYVPLTFHIKGEQNQYEQIARYEEGIIDKKQKQKFLWIVKPGENSNRGCGIQVCKKVQQIKRYVQKEKQKHPERTYVVQKYISPFLFHRRKFDIRCFLLVTSTPQISAYFYPIGYIRTSSFEFNYKNCANKLIHLTNDAIQKKASEYSKYESGNKVRFEEFQKYLDLFQAKKNLNFFNQILPSIRDMMLLSIKSARNFSGSRKEHTFEILGYDFMIDEDFHPWLIEINTNPCLQTGCDVLNEIIPSMLENCVKIAVDPIFKPPKIDDWPLNQLFTCPDKILQTNKFELIYSQNQAK